MKKNAVAIIPARGGSKRIPKKNIKLFHGKPIISYTIEVALKSKLFDKIIVNTDDKEIAKVAIKYGAEVPYLRPKELSDDYTHIGPVIENTLEYLTNIGENYTYMCLLYATSPLLQVKYLQEGFETLVKHDAKSSFGATSMPFPIQRTFKIKEDGRCEMFMPEHFNTRSQDLEEAYHDAALFTWTNLKKKSTEPSYGNDSIPIIIPRYMVQDIDTMEDWERAELIYEVFNKDNTSFTSSKEEDRSTRAK